MDTKFLNKEGTRFFFATQEKGGFLPFILWPSLWWETKNQGLGIQITRISFGIAKWRIHCHFGKRIAPPNTPMRIPSSFTVWANQWSGRPIGENDFMAWIKQSDFQDIIKWGGLNFHYARVLLVREFLSSQTSPRTNKNPIIAQASDDDDEVTLDITWDDYSSVGDEAGISGTEEKQNPPH